MTQYRFYQYVIGWRFIIDGLLVHIGFNGKRRVLDNLNTSHMFEKHRFKLLAIFPIGPNFIKNSIIL